MPFPIEEKLVVAIASSALFDLSESHRVYREQGTESYRAYQRAHERDILEPGVAFPLVRRLLAIEGLEEDNHPVEVVLLSRNDPDTGVRVFHSIDHYGLRISRAAFVSGRNPFPYMNSFNACLFLSANADDVRKAVDRGLPAGRVFPTEFADDKAEPELRIAFDFDGVLAGDSAEAVFQQEGLAAFRSAERELSGEPLEPGPLKRFFAEIGRVQAIEKKHASSDPSYEPQIRTAIVTARDAPAHERMVTTLRSWGILVDEGFFLGGVEKSRVLQVFRPHIFFDDQLRHIEGTAHVTPSVHVPYGVSNAPSEDVVDEAFEEHRKRSEERENREGESSGDVRNLA